MRNNLGEETKKSKRPFINSPWGGGGNFCRRILTTHAKTRPILRGDWSIRLGENIPDRDLKHLAAMFTCIVIQKVARSHKRIPNLGTSVYTYILTIDQFCSVQDSYGMFDIPWRSNSNIYQLQLLFRFSVSFHR